jgi:hypothetical protein
MAALTRGANRNIICITIGPVFFAAAIYLVLSRIIVHYGPRHSRLSTKAMSVGFMTSDFVALLLQALGGAVADTGGSARVDDIGTHVLVGGLSFQVLSLLVFIGVAAEFAWRARRYRRRQAQYEQSEEKTPTDLKIFQIGASPLTLSPHQDIIFREDNFTNCLFFNQLSHSQQYAY